MSIKLKALLMALLSATALLISTGTAQAQGCTIALTFDDGPGPYTNQIVDALNAHGAKATFFMVGNMVNANPGAAQHVAASGHRLGSHSMWHDDLQGKSPGAAAADVQQAADTIGNVTGIRPNIWRPPYGSHNGAIDSAVGMPAIMWTYDSMDYATHDTQSTYNNVTRNAQCGGIVLMHDIHASTAAAVPGILDNLQSRGFQMVTV